MESRPTQHLDKPPALSTLNSSNAIHGGVNDPPILRRRIIACLDGTWDTPSARTNVFRFCTSLETSHNLLVVPPEEHPHYPNQQTHQTAWWDRSNRTIGVVGDHPGEKWFQIAEYFKGVGGDEEGVRKYLGGLFGLGISHQILMAYKFLCENYQSERDEIWLIGASRGAYAARSLAGFIYNVGLLPVRHLQKHVGKAYDLYRSNDKGSHPDSGSRALAFRQTYDCREPVIRFLGCWDTVGSLGIPHLPWYLGGSVPYALFHGLHSFHDIKLSSQVISAFHALSIHEQREWFCPTLMRYASKKKRDNQELEQLWFPGTHSDVIGGPTSARVLCNHALRWMMIKARERGLVFRHAIEDICGGGAFYYVDSYDNELVYRLVRRKDRYIDPILFPTNRCLYMSGKFSYITDDQLLLYPSKTLERFYDDLAWRAEQEEEQQALLEAERRLAEESHLLIFPRQE